MKVTLRIALALTLTNLANIWSQAFAVPMTVNPGFDVTTFNVGFESDGLASGPGGVFGTDLYIATNGAVVRLDPSTGNVTQFVSGLAVGSSRPSGLDFDNGAFGTGQLYV